jgi:hypothetical protein
MKKRQQTRAGEGKWGVHAKIALCVGAPFNRMTPAHTYSQPWEVFRPTHVLLDALHTVVPSVSPFGPQPDGRCGYV